jgi:hypothetical protein
MPAQSNSIQPGKVDVKALSALIAELNIARRNSNAYPKGHPVVAASLAKVLKVYEELLHIHGELILGVTSETLMIDGEVLEKANVVYRDFSHALFERGIGALLCHRGLTIDEITNFTAILSLKREMIYQLGGIDQVWSTFGIVAMAIRSIRYDVFQAAGDGTATGSGDIAPKEELWDRFARELTMGELPQGSSIDVFLDPEILAEVLNQQFERGDINEAGVSGAIGNLLSPSFAENSFAESPSGTIDSQPYEKLAAFFSNLTPKLRNQFLGSTFGAKNKDRQSAAEQILTNLSDSAIIETLEDINSDRLNVSPVVFGLLQRLARNANSSQHTADDMLDEDNLSQKIKTIFREHDSEEFVPDNYQRKLNHIISSDRIPRQNMDEVADLMKTLEVLSVEGSIGQMLISFIRDGVETPEERKLLLQNLSDMFGFYLQTGDYGQLHKLMDQLTDGTFPDEIQSCLRAEYGRRDYLEEILDGLSIWGKPRYDDIRSLILKIGGAFVEAILDRLAEEKNMSLRRFFMDCLIELGPLTREPIVSRLKDKRWYFLRNLLIILTAQNDPSIVPLIRPMLRSDDPRVRHESLKVLVHFHDPQAEKKLLEDLDSNNPEQQNVAIQLAERCTTPTIAAKLTDMLMSGGFSQVECDKKLTLVHSLGEIGRAEVLPTLAKILGTRSLLHSRQLTRLKTGIINSLPKYPPGVSRPILEHIAGGSGEIARLASETLKIIAGKSA